MIKEENHMRKILVCFMLIFSFVFLSHNIACNNNNNQEYVVTFVDWDGTILKNYVAQSGESAIAPSDPSRDGYTFLGWDKDFTEVYSNLTVNAVYEEIKIYYKVSFYSDGELIASSDVLAHSSATAPTVNPKTGYTFVGWDVDFYDVSSDLIVNALFEEGNINTFTVNYYDYNGTLFASKIIKENGNGYGVIPSSIDGLTFVGWNVSLVNVSCDIDAFPIYLHEEVDLDSEISAYINYDGDVSITGNGVVKSDNRNVTITQEGIYVLSGESSDASVSVAKNTGKVILLLNNITLTSSTSPIQLKGGSNEITITALEGTINTFTDTYRNAESPKSCINGSKDLVINGSGTIIVYGNNKNGIKTDEGLFIENVNLKVTSVDNGIAADKEIRITNATVTIDSQSDCIKSNPDAMSDSYPSNIYVYGGTINLIALDDGFQCLGTIY